MRVAIVHDYIKEYGGAERVLESLHELWPNAPVFTTVYLPEYLGPHRERFKNWDIRTSWLQVIPFKAKLISPFRLLAPFVFGGMNFSKFDVVIVSATGAYNPNLISKDGTVQICYCHTPPRYLYGYPTARDWTKNAAVRVLSNIANHFLRIVDFKSAQNVDFFVANSLNIKKRIDKFYRRDAVVIYPPVEVGSEKWEVRSGKEYFLTGGRLARPKRIDLAIRACTKLKLPLKVFGKEFAGYGEELKDMAGSTVEFLGEVSEEEKYDLMHSAKAFIFPAEEEDFGITPVEAMMAGTPIIAARSGGVVESVVEGKTGVFFDEQNVGSLVSAIKNFEKKKWNRVEIAKYARKFSKERFKREIRDFIQSRVK